VQHSIEQVFRIKESFRRSPIVTVQNPCVLEVCLLRGCSYFLSTVIPVFASHCLIDHDDRIAWVFEAIRSIMFFQIEKLNSLSW